MAGFLLLEREPPHSLLLMGELSHRQWRVCPCLLMGMLDSAQRRRVHKQELLDMLLNGLMPHRQNIRPASNREGFLMRIKIPQLREERLFPDM